MKNYLKPIAFLSIFVLHCSDIKAEEDPKASQKIPSAKNVNDPESTVSKTAEAYRNILKDGKVPSSVLKNTQCVAVFPSVMTVALGVGGTHGDGVAFCRNTSGNWGNPTFLDLNGGSIGIQAGVKSADVVLYLTTKNAREMIKKGDFTLTGELSAVAGTFDENFVAPREGVVAYVKQEGVFAGASVDGININHDKDEQRAFYGTYDPESISEGQMPLKVSKAINELKAMLPSQS